MDATVSGTIANLTLLGNQCIVGKGASGRARAPLTLMTSNANYNAMYSALLMASTNRCPVDLTSGNAGISMLKVRVQ